MIVAPLEGEVMVTTGDVLSRLIVAAVVAVLSALSTTAPEMSWPAPSVVTLTGGVQEATPLKASEQVNEMMTFELFQPAAFGGGAVATPIAGNVLSMFNATEVLALNPAWFTTVPLTIWFAPSAVT